jgi:hypothetical protein
MENTSILLKNTKEFKEKINNFMNMHEKILKYPINVTTKDSKNY